MLPFAPLPNSHLEFPTDDKKRIIAQLFQDSTKKLNPIGQNIFKSKSYLALLPGEPSQLKMHINCLLYCTEDRNPTPSWVGTSTRSK
jgi:hypothetical protein